MSSSVIKKRGYYLVRACLLLLSLPRCHYHCRMRVVIVLFAAVEMFDRRVFTLVYVHKFSQEKTICSYRIHSPISDAVTRTKLVRKVTIYHPIWDVVTGTSLFR